LLLHIVVVDDGRVFIEYDGMAHGITEAPME
jgi:hypothetical protein